MNKEQFIALAKEEVCDLPFEAEDPSCSLLEPDDLLELAYGESHHTFSLLLCPRIDCNRVFFICWNASRQGYLSIVPLCITKHIEVHIDNK